jgi:hypothetical protein
VSAVDDGYVCPNGHAVDPVRVHNCPTCRAGVVYVPGEHCMLLQLALYRAHAVLDSEQAHTGETWADRTRWPRPPRGR